MNILKPLFFAALLFYLLAVPQSNKKNVTITVAVDSAICSVPQWVYLYYLDDNEFYLEDSAKISSENREISLRGYISCQLGMNLFFAKKGPNNVHLIVNPGDSIGVEINESDGDGAVWKKVMGSSATNEEIIFTDKLHFLQLSQLKSRGEIYANSDTLFLKELNDSVKELASAIQGHYKKAIKQSENPYFVWKCFVCLPSNGFETDSIEKIRSEIQMRFPNYPKIQALGKDTIYPSSSKVSKEASRRIAMMRKSKRVQIQKSKDRVVAFPSKENVADMLPVSGRMALWNFTLPTIKGDSLALSQQKGKYVLLDFWASWCMPCIKELFVAKQIHERFSDYVTVCLISLDTNKSNWRSAIKKLELEHLNNLSAVDERGRMNGAIERLNLKTIPANYLLDPQGNIIQIDLQGQKLIQTIDSLIKQ